MVHHLLIVVHHLLIVVHHFMIMVHRLLIMVHQLCIAVHHWLFLVHHFIDYQYAFTIVTMRHHFWLRCTVCWFLCKGNWWWCTIFFEIMWCIILLIMFDQFLYNFGVYLGFCNIISWDIKFFHSFGPLFFPKLFKLEK